MTNVVGVAVLRTRRFARLLRGERLRCLALARTGAPLAGVRPRDFPAREILWDVWVRFRTLPLERAGAGRWDLFFLGRDGIAFIDNLPRCLDKALTGQTIR